MDNSKIKSFLIILIVILVCGCGCRCSCTLSHSNGPEGEDVPQMPKIEEDKDAPVREK